MIPLPETIVCRAQSEHRLELEFALTPEHPCFAGHFDGLPVLAAVVQIGWAQALAERYFDRRFVFRALQSNKFQQLIRPPVTLTVELEYRPEKELLTFSYRNARGLCSKGAISVEAAVP